jgi:hypothetical protein
MAALASSGGIAISSIFLVVLQAPYGERDELLILGRTEDLTESLFGCNI